MHVVLQEWDWECIELLYTVCVVPQEQDWDRECIELLYIVCVVLQEWDWERIELLYTVCCSAGAGLGPGVH